MFPFKTALNASTLFPFELDIEQQVRVAAEAGYDGFELWVKDVDAYLEQGGSLARLRHYIADTGINLANAIAFFRWADEDPAVREQGFAQAAREMQALAELGCPAVAAPPFGDVAGMSLDAMAEQFARLTDLARAIGIEPYLEFWGRARRLSRLSEAIYVALESRKPGVKLLLDPFHMYTGGSDVAGIAYLSGAAIGIVHVNDYPAEPSRAEIGDRDRVLPGSGIAPSRQLAAALVQTGYQGYLSLELFVDDFGARAPADVARAGLDAIRTAYTVAD